MIFLLIERTEALPPCSWPRGRREGIRRPRRATSRQNRFCALSGVFLYFLISGYTVVDRRENSGIMIGDKNKRQSHRKSSYDVHWHRARPPGRFCLRLIASCGACCICMEGSHYANATIFPPYSAAFGRGPADDRRRVPYGCHDSFESCSRDGGRRTLSAWRRSPQRCPDHCIRGRRNPGDAKASAKADERL